MPEAAEDLWVRTRRDAESLLRILGLTGSCLYLRFCFGFECVRPWAWLLHERILVPCHIYSALQRSGGSESGMQPEG